MSEFIEYLETRSEKDTKLRATLRRSLAFSPGTFVDAYPYVEPFVKEANKWRRQAHYLVAGLWAAQWREGKQGQAVPIGRACAAHMQATGSSSTERRFINLLDADADQLPHRLRQVVALLKDQPIDFDALLGGLLYWNDDARRTQNNWAREFYRSLDDEPHDEPALKEEVAP